VDESDGQLQFKSYNYEDVPISQILYKLHHRKMDIVVAIDSCSVKKGAKSTEVMPKIVIHQIILHPVTNTS